MLSVLLVEAVSLRKVSVWSWVLALAGALRARPQCPVVDDPGIGGDVGQTLHER